MRVTTHIASSTTRLVKLRVVVDHVASLTPRLAFLLIIRNLNPFSLQIFINLMLVVGKHCVRSKFAKVKL